MPKIKTSCCICGTELYRWPYLIRASKGKSYCNKCRSKCTCGKTSPNKANLIGQKFGLLTVIAEYGSRNGHALWKCQCECGNIKISTTGILNSGGIKSCGCLRFRNGKEHPNYKKGFHVTEHGYKEVSIENCKKSHRYYAEHRLVMEKYLKRKLHSEEVVHHINGNKLDNRIENLIVLSREEHAAIHARERV